MATASTARVFRRLGPTFVGSTVALLLVLCFGATVSPARAVRPTPAPSPSGDLGPLSSPTALDPSAEPTTEPTIGPDPSVSPDPSAGPSLEPSAAPPPQLPAELRVDHVWIDTIDPRTGGLTEGAVDTPASALERSRIYVVRFQVVNGTDAAIDVHPVLEYGAGVAAMSWTAVPAVDPVVGVAFYTSSNVRRGEDPGTSVIAIDQLRLAVSAEALGLPAPGVAHAGVNPGSTTSLAPHAFTELAFTFRATADADWLAAYSLRISDGGVPITGTGMAVVEMRARPALQLSPGQRSGVDVEPPVVYSSSGSAGVGSIRALSPLSTSPHGPYTLTTDACAACHTTHTAKGPMLTNQPAPQATLCFTCHDGSPASNIKAQYTDPSVPANNPGTASYYSHAATGLTSPVCADCHQPHLADGTPAVETTNGWTASGAIFGASGVSVVNGAAGDAPTYTATRTSAFEYQLCFKCHSGYAGPLDQSGPPSTWRLDKAVELNPANNSYHPVEAPGKNQTAQLDVSLSGDPVWGTSPYKLWNFTTDSTVRCVSCHGDSRLGNPLSPPDAGDRLAPHAVVNRGILIENLRNRVLKGSSEAYQAADFALCYVCHAEAPFVEQSGDPLVDTNFRYHGLHTAGIATFEGPGGTVDQDGAGNGNAICAECHFRTHGTTFAVDGQPAWGRLVNFAPNVQPYQGSEVPYAGQLLWNTANHSCTLTCHGVNHKAWSY